MLQALRSARKLPLGEACVQATQLAETGLIGTVAEMEMLAIHLERVSLIRLLVDQMCLSG
ncbi:hypothetical protein [Streptomyces sp. V1I6]|uniref:hypothetical protein n=1 Tax=Streptomyces sp. V1I6 TaxID=3042273 RepID=UPI0027827901|nr:hypothetical protein [Streptomyces sp. V1I6]MDQ0840321.1 hypothetical protein [Streptomyces sp. V1I6]